MARAFLDTTVLVDATLKERSVRRATAAAAGRFADRLLPVYAIKEFKAGPLSYFKWFHNRLAQSRTFAEAIRFVQALSRTPQRYRTATALSALEGAGTEFQDLTNASLVQRYGPKASLDASLLDLVRLNVQQRIYAAWRMRRQIATEVVDATACYEEVGPTLKRGLIELVPSDCRRGTVCGLSERVKADRDLLVKLHAVSKESARKPENAKRAGVLRNLVRKPREPLLSEGCRALGDAMFVILAPSDATILTTNLADYEPLSRAAGTCQRE